MGSNIRCQLQKYEVFNRAVEEDIKDFGNQVNSMDMVKCIIQMDKYIKDNG